jgi:DDE superfamily endonuclease
MRAPDAQKNPLKPWLKQCWCIPPEANAEFVCCMEDVLEVYQRPFDPKRPLVCMDEISKQLVADSRPPLPMQPGKPERYDYEYVRHGTANVFLFFAPLLSWRHTKVTDHRARTDWAEAMREVIDVQFPEAEMIVLVMDNLNTHGPASFYETFEPAEARRLAAKLEIHYTPKHGSWLNMAEIELSVFDRQCLDRRLPQKELVEQEATAWEAERNARGMTVDWRFTTADARIKLKRLYPSMSP